jgi:hypothetical protein
MRIISARASAFVIFVWRFFNKMGSHLWSIEHFKKHSRSRKKHDRKNVRK